MKKTLVLSSLIAALISGCGDKTPFGLVAENEFSDGKGKINARYCYHPTGINVKKEDILVHKADGEVYWRCLNGFGDTKIKAGPDITEKTWGLGVCVMDKEKRSEYMHVGSAYTGELPFSDIINEGELIYVIRDGSNSWENVPKPQDDQKKWFKNFIIFYYDNKGQFNVSFSVRRGKNE